MKHVLPDLPYSYDALKPYIDARTMEIHHTKHHQAYIDNPNAALEGHDALTDLQVDELLKKFDQVPDTIKTAVRNHGGGHANHLFFWTILKKDVAPSGPVVDAIKDKFGSMEEFEKLFSQAAMSRFGSGWAWLVATQDKGLEITSTPNQDSPLMESKIPIVGIDVWEHAYYLNYQNRRAEYVKNFFKVINWDAVNEKFSVINS